MHCGVEFSSFFSVKDTGACAVKLTLGSRSKKQHWLLPAKSFCLPACAAQLLRACRGSSLPLCRHCSGHLRNSNLQSMIMRSFVTLLAYGLMFARESFLCWVSSTFATQDKLDHVCLWDWELSKRRKGRRRDRSKARDGKRKSNTVVVFLHGNYLLFNSNMKSMYGWRFGTSNSIQGPLWVPLFSWSM